MLRYNTNLPSSSRPNPGKSLPPGDLSPMRPQPMKKIVRLLPSLTVLFGMLLSLAPFQPARAVNRQADLQLKWRLSNPDGFSDQGNYFTSLGVFQDQLYAGSSNSTGAQVWRTQDGQTWVSFPTSWETSTIFIYDIESFGSWLYFGTNGSTGAQIWRTDGTNWEQVVADGFGDAGNQAVSVLVVFSDMLYAAAINNGGLQLWRSPSGDKDSWTQAGSDWQSASGMSGNTTLDVFNGWLYLGLSRYHPEKSGMLAELWRSSNGTTWEPAFTDGLGDTGNAEVTSMAGFNGFFYIGFTNWTTGGQVWHSTDGSHWTSVFTDGLGKSANRRPDGLIVFDNHLYLIFSNSNDGVGVWQSADGDNWRQVASGGWGDTDNYGAGHFDKGVQEFKHSLFITTQNWDSGSEVWQYRYMNQIYLPLGIRDVMVPHAFLISPADGSTVDSLAPVFRWSIEQDPNEFFSYLAITNQPYGYMTCLAPCIWGRRTFSGHEVTEDLAWNLEPDTKYYWHAINEDGTTSGMWSFTTGSGGNLPPVPALSAPAGGAVISRLASMQLSWQPVEGATDYQVHVVWTNPDGGSGQEFYCREYDTSHSYGANYFPVGVNTWTVSARNAYGWAESESRTFTITDP
jgi:hypothetical protein